ncbi:MAG TPA: protein phosphatase 2C domain-containing protein [Anaerolineales bacterium]|nr:protein phosphatase 2C domain-containing protein [Anaerolineales bacterium]
MYKFKVLSKSNWEGKDDFYAIQTCAMSVRCQQKPTNEDFVFHRATQMPSGHPIALLVVCDGMGGYQVGSFASELATHIVTTEIGKLFPHEDFLHTHIEQPTIPRASKLQTWLKETVQEANRLIFEYASNQPEIRHSGTRMTLALIQCRTAYIAHVGDTRAYLWRNFELTQITEDHSIAAELEKGGILEPTKALNHPFRKILFRSVGTQPEVKPEIYTISLRPGDKLMLCSDGLWNAFDDVHPLADILENDFHPNNLSAMLIDEARVRNNRDDISVALACVNTLS